MSGRTPIMRPARQRGGANQGGFNVTFFVLTIIVGFCIFAGTTAMIRFWQRFDPLEPWLRGHPRLDPDHHAKKLAEGAVPWLGAEAGILDATLLMGRRPAVGPAGATGWWQEESREDELEGLPFLHLGVGDHEGVEHMEVSTKSQFSEVSGKTEAQTKEGLTGRGGAAAEKSGLGLEAQVYPAFREDLVVAIPTHQSTEPQLKAGRSARMGLRTFVVTNYTEGTAGRYPKAENEVWSFYPDAKPVRSFYAGDDRAALAPFLAFKELGDTFKWLLYGDDDTVFFADAALKLAATLDPELPYFVTDNLWFSGMFDGARHPHPQAPRCLPCNYRKNATEALQMKLAVGCPCTPQLMCSLQGGYNGTFAGHTGCGAPRSPVRTYSMHGGAGALISIGLLRRVDWTSMERCVNHQWSSGGDAFISTCLWEHGFAHSTPDPVWHPAGLQMFDPSPPPMNPDDFIIWKASHVLGNLLRDAAGVCTGLCKLEVENTVTIHLRARRTGGSDEGAAMFVRAFSRLYSRLTGLLTPASAKHLDDGSSFWTAAVAAEIDAQMEAGFDAVRKLCSLQEDINRPSHAESAEQLTLSSPFGAVAAKDQALAGIANAVASRILSNILELVKHLAEGKSAQEAVKAAGLPGDSVEDFVAELVKRLKAQKAQA